MLRKPTNPISRLGGYLTRSIHKISNKWKKLKTVAAFSFKEGASSLLELLDAQRSY